MRIDTNREDKNPLDKYMIINNQQRRLLANIILPNDVIHMMQFM